MPTLKDAPYKLAQRVRAEPRLLMASRILRAYQKKYHASALHMAKKAREILARQNSE